MRLTLFSQSLNETRLAPSSRNAPDPCTLYLYMVAHDVVDSKCMSALVLQMRSKCVSGLCTSSYILMNPRHFRVYAVPITTLLIYWRGWSVQAHIWLPCSFSAP